jgi:A/G-specific adenine glycosylase
MSHADEIINQLTSTHITQIQTHLLDWYRQNRRDLPWRREKDPYKIWVSEVMLQQTRVETVIPYFERFMQRFPTLSDLAAATEEEVMKEWEGLGYYSRIRNLHAAVKEVKAKYGGHVPAQKEAISQLKGVGSYTAGAVLSIAYGQPEPAVDGNVMRVFSRWYMIEDDIAQVKTRKAMERIASRLIPPEAPGDFNQALMELGATVCLPSSPYCLLCPVQEECQALAASRQKEFPHKKKKKPPRKQQVVFLLFLHEKSLLVERRPANGLLSNMWALPTLEIAEGSDSEVVIENWLQEQGLVSEDRQEIAQLEHVFSHRHWNVSLQVAHCPTMALPHAEPLQWWPIERFSQVAKASVYRKAFELYLEYQKHL